MKNDTPRTPVESTDVPPSLDVGTTAFFQPGGGQQSLARLRFDKPQGITLYVFWDPYKNNPQGIPSDQFQTLGFPVGVARKVFGAFGRIKIGMQQTITELNFDIPYEQQIAIPLVCDYCEVTAKIIAPVFGKGNPPLASPTIQAFNDPAEFPILAGDAFPNVSQQYPRGVVSISAMVGKGNIGRKSVVGGGTGPVRIAYIGALAAADTRFVPVAFGATHFELRASDPLVTATCWVDLFLGGGVFKFPTTVNSNTPSRLPLYAQGIEVTNGGAGASAVEVIQYIGY